MDNTEFLIRCYHLISSRNTPITLNKISGSIHLSLFQIQRKFARFGIDSGKTGVGFKHKPLREKLESLLGLKRCKIAVVGCGAIGLELLRSRWFNDNYDIAGIFDFRTEIIGSEYSIHIWEDASNLSDAIKERGIDIVAIAQADHMDVITAELKKTSIQSVWNLSLEHIEIPDIMIEDAFDGLMRLSFHITNSKKKGMQDESE